MITERAMLAAVHISIWTAVKHDRKVSRDVADQRRLVGNGMRWRIGCEYRGQLRQRPNRYPSASQEKRRFLLSHSRALAGRVWHVEIRRHQT
jgi:hypothetical protein